MIFIVPSGDTITLSVLPGLVSGLLGCAPLCCAGLGWVMSMLSVRATRSVLQRVLGAVA